MALVNDRCICLYKTQYSETSQILTLFARTYGIVRVIAKGAHRRTKAGASRFDGGVDLLDAGDAVFTHDPARALATLTDWRLLEGQQGLRQSLRAIYLATYAAELTGRLIEEHDAHPDLYDRLEAVLPELATARREQAFLSFELDLLQESGYLPEVWACVACGRLADAWPKAWFSLSRGGILCHDCQSTDPRRRQLDLRLLRLLQTILRAPASPVHERRLPQLSRHLTDPLNRLLADHVENTLSQKLRMRRYVLD